MIDCGFVKEKFYDPWSHQERLLVVPVSRAAARQRAGRAGRTRPGKCFRLYTEVMYHTLSSRSAPEVQRVSLVPLVLQLKALGIDDVVHFDYASPPPSKSLERALEVLFALGALDPAAQLSADIGIRLCEFPLDPPLARMVSFHHRFDDSKRKKRSCCFLISMYISMFLFLDKFLGQ